MHPLWGCAFQWQRDPWSKLTSILTLFLRLSLHRILSQWQARDLGSGETQWGAECTAGIWAPETAWPLTSTVIEDKYFDPYGGSVLSLWNGLFLSQISVFLFCFFFSFLWTTQEKPLEQRCWIHHVGPCWRWRLVGPLQGCWFSEILVSDTARGDLMSKKIALETA